MDDDDDSFPFISFLARNEMKGKERNHQHEQYSEIKKFGSNLALKKVKRLFLKL